MAKRRCLATGLILMVGSLHVLSHSALAAPPPIARVRPAHALVAITLEGYPAATTLRELLRLLEQQGAKATLFVPVESVRTLPAAFPVALARLEIGLRCQRSCPDLARAVSELGRRLGERPSLFRPPANDPVLVEQAYRVGLVSVLWSKALPSDPSRLDAALATVRAGDILNLQLEGAASLANLAAVLARLRQAGLSPTSATALLEDTRGHLEICARFVPPAGTPLPPGLVPSLLWRFGGPGRRLVRHFYGVRRGVSVAGRQLGGLLPAEARRELAALAPRFFRAPVDARIDRQTGSVVPEEPGHELDVEATYRAVMAAKPGEAVPPVLRTLPARWRAADLQALTAELGRYRTWISGSSGRYENIVKGAALLNHQLVLPGATFSTLSAIGRPDRRGGWRLAPVIVGGSFVEGVGGGLCQVSSTLYNAVRRAGLEIVERHHHARAVHYVPRGQDATIAWPHLDFRFRNNRRTPILLKAYVRGGALVISVYGNPADSSTEMRSRGARK